MATETTDKTFTQAELEAQVEERIARDRKARGWSDDDAKALKQFRDAEKNREIEDAKQRKEFEKAAELREAQHQEALGKEKQRADEIHGRYKSERITNALMAETASAINPQQVVTLLRDRVTLDDDFRPVVLDANGKPTTQTVAKLVADFLGENKHFVKAGAAGQSQGTAGAGGNSTGDRSTPGGPLEELGKAQELLETLSAKAAKTGRSEDNQAVLKQNTLVQQLKAKAKAEGLLA